MRLIAPAIGTFGLGARATLPGGTMMYVGAGGDRALGGGWQSASEGGGGDGKGK
jgi:hypothetical protein